MRQSLRISLSGSLLVLFACSISLLQGCSLLRLQGDEQERKQGFFIVGFVKNLAPDSRIVVFAVSTETGTLEDFDILEEGGSFVLSLKRGRYRVFAFEDLNRDARYTAGECLAGSSESVLVDGKEITTYTTLQLDLNGKHTTCPYDLASMAFAHNDGNRTGKLRTGATVSLDMPLFDERFVRQGLWTPYRAFKRHGAKILFLEAYDPSRRPVLFIHGIDGSPRDLVRLIEALDRSRFQPWVYYYPTGQRLDKSAHALYLELLTLQSRLGDFPLDMVCYSLGGLVGKRFLDLHGYHTTRVFRFISIATPWGGHEKAASGVRNLSVPIPVWESLTPKGESITAMARTPFPAATRFYQIGSSGQGADGTERTDGFVPLKSIYDSRMTGKAAAVYTVNESHSSIVKSAEVAAIMRTILALPRPRSPYQY